MKLIELLVVGHPRKVILALVLITALLLPGLFQRRTDVSVENFLPDSDTALSHYRQFVDTFGNDNLLVAFYRVENPFSDESLETAKRLGDSLRRLPEVSGTFGITDAVTVNPLSPAPIVPILTDLPPIEAQRRTLQNIVMNSDLYKGKVVSADGRFLIIIVFLENYVVLDDEARAAAVDNIRSVLREEARGGEIMLAGSALLKTRMSEAVQHDFTFLAPLVVLLSLLFLWCGFRSLRSLLFGMGAIAMTLLWTLSIFFLAGYTLNMATILLPSLVMALSLSQVIYIISQYLGTDGEAAQRVAETVRKASAPCFLAALTTAAGFLSLTATSVLPVRDLGVTAACGIAIAFLTAILFVPSSLRLRPIAPRSAARRAEPLWYAAISGLSYRRGWIAIITLILMALSLFGIAAVRIETSPYEFFPPNDRLNRARESYMEATGYDATLNVMIYRKDGLPINGSSLAEIARLRDAVSADPLIVDSLSLLTIGKFVVGSEQAFISLLGSDSRPGRRSPLLDVFTRDDLFKRYISRDLKSAAMTLMLRDHAAERIREAIDLVEKEAPEKAPGLNIVATGQTALFAKMVDHLFFSQVASVALIMTFVTLVFMLAFRSVFIGLLSLIPTSTPIILTLGLMGRLAIPLNIATIMVSGIAIGISVDASIHFLHQLRARLAEGLEYDEALDRTIRTKGRPIIFTSVLLASAFLCYLFSSFLPIFYLGALTAFTMLGALIGALVLFPALLRTFKPKF